MEMQDMIVEAPIRTEVVRHSHFAAPSPYCDCPPVDVTVWVRAWVILEKDSQIYRLCDIVVFDDSKDYGLTWDDLDAGQKSDAEDSLIRAYEAKLSLEGRAHE